MRLEIRLRQTQEPILQLDQDDYGIAVTGGDARLVQALKLNQFKDLKEIADYLNSDPSGQYEASFDEGQEPQAEPDRADQLDERLAPAIQTIRELMSRVKSRQDQEKAKEESEKPEAQILSSTDSQVVMNPAEMIYVSFDGDNIGNAVARAERTDDEQALAAISTKINAGQNLFQQWVQQNGGQVVEQGGDEGLAKIPGSALERIEEFRAQYLALVGATCSVGVGNKISEATDARMLAKLKGKNRTEQFNETTRQELKLRLDEKGDAESRKISEALAPHSPTDQPQPVGPAQPQVEAASQPSPADQQDPASQEEQPKEQEAPPQASSETAERAVSAQLSPDLIKAVQQRLQSSSRSQSDFRNSAHWDQGIEDSDYSESDDPDFAKALRYIVKYGVRP